MEVIEVTEREIEVIEVIERGPQGPVGATGPQGPAGAGGVTSVTGTAPIVSSGGTTPAISVTVGTTANTVCAGDDARLSDARTPVSHTHAAADITSGTLTHERGGLEADVSAYNGLLKISGGSTSAVGIGTGSTEVAAGDHGHGNLTSDGKLGSTAGLPVVTTTAGAVTTLALGTANQVLRVNSGATGVEFADPAASGVTGAAASASDVLGVSGANITGVDANADRIVYWNNTSNKLAYGTPADAGAAAASHTHAASDVTSGVFDNARINFAAPPAIGGTSAAAGSFTTLSASTSLTLGTSGIFSGGTNTIEQRNTTSAQTFRIYNTVSGAADANFERGFIGWSANTLRIGTEAGGTGNGNRNIHLMTNGAARMIVASEGIYINALLFQGNASVQATFGSGIIRLVDWGGSSFDRLQFGGGTSSFPALKRSSTTLQVRLADDSAFAPLDAGTINATGAVAATSFVRANGFQCSTGSAGITFGDGFTSIIGPSTAGVLRIQAFNNTDVLIGIGGNTSSWPALNSSGSTLRIRLADNSGFAPLSCGALTLNGNLDASTRNIVTDTTTGTKIGTATTQKLGFFNATPVDQPNTVADPAGGGTIDTEARTAINDIIDRLQELGLIA